VLPEDRGWAADPSAGSRSGPGLDREGRDQNLDARSVRPGDLRVSKCALPWAFWPGIFTEDVRTAFVAAERFAASAVMVNDHTAFHADWMPFAGRRQSV